MKHVMLKETYVLPCLPPPVELETTQVLKQLAKAHRALGDLKGGAATLPNQGILINTLGLQEAKASSEIENIVTTQDKLFHAESFPERPMSPELKEVSQYRRALHLGYENLHRTGGSIPQNTLIEMFHLLMGRENEGYRVIPGTKITRGPETIYVPPQNAHKIKDLMNDLERFINDDDASSLDPLIKMAVIHHQFESIHPFSDGNGRIGRILNVLYLVRTELLKIPILYLSRAITHSKDHYYRLLQDVQVSGGTQSAWENWVLYMLQAVAETAQTSLEIVEGIRRQMEDMKTRMRTQVPKIYSRELLNILFHRPYTRIKFVMENLKVTRPTATRYLDTLARHGLVTKHRFGRDNYYINAALVQMLRNASGETAES